MNSKNLSLIKRKLKKLLKNKKIIDIILFGSSVKGKASPNDFDIAVITEQELELSMKNFHISILKPKDFLIKPPTIVTTLLKEGYSLKQNKMFSEILRFKPSIMFSYSLKSLKNSKKVKIVNILRGKSKEKGIVANLKGKWISNSTFIIPPESEFLIEKFLINHEINFQKMHLLIH